MQATTSGRMAHQPAILAAGAAVVIATTLVVAAAGAQGLRFGDKSPAAAPAPTSPQAVERALVKVRASEHDGLTPGWATGSAAATIGSYPFPDKAAGHVGLSELATGGIASGTAPNLPVGNWGLSEVRPNGSTLSQDEIEIPAGAYAPGRPQQPGLQARRRVRLDAQPGQPELQRAREPAPGREVPHPGGRGARRLQQGRPLASVAP